MRTIRLLAIACTLLALTVAALAYDDEARRDPFMMKAPEPPAPDVPGTGLPAYTIDEVALTGISRLDGDAVAVLTGPDEKGYFARVGDSLYDGTIDAIDFDKGIVTFRQWGVDAKLIERQLHP